MVVSICSVSERKATPCACPLRILLPLVDELSNKFRLDLVSDASFGDSFGGLKYQYVQSEHWRLAATARVRFPPAGGDCRGKQGSASGHLCLA